MIKTELNPINPTRLLYEMLQIYSPSGQEEKIAFFLKNQLSETGFKKVRVDKAGNVFGEVGTGHPTILLCGHMDTVPCFLPPKVEFDKIYGRGAVDAKSSLAAMIVAASRFIGKDLKGKIVLAGVVDEEGQGKGIRQIIEDKIETEYAIFGEPSGIGNVTIGYKGRVLATIALETQGGHASVPQAFENAIDKAYDLWKRIRHSSRDGEKSNFYSITTSLTGIRGGEASNVIPRHCRINIDLRFPPSTNCMKITECLNNHIVKFNLKNPDVKIKMGIEDKIEPVIANKNSKLIKAISEGIKDTIGKQVKYLKKTGTGDMNVFAEYTDCQIATYGPGNSKMSHTNKEYVKIEDLHTAINILKKTIINILKN